MSPQNLPSTLNYAKTLRHASVTFPGISGGIKGKLEKDNMHKKVHGDLTFFSLTMAWSLCEHFFMAFV